MYFCECISCLCGDIRKNARVRSQFVFDESKPLNKVSSLNNFVKLWQSSNRFLDVYNMIRNFITFSSSSQLMATFKMFGLMLSQVISRAFFRTSTFVTFVYNFFEICNDASNRHKHDFCTRLQRFGDRFT